MLNLATESGMDILNVFMTLYSDVRKTSLLFMKKTSDGVLAHMLDLR